MDFRLAIAAEVNAAWLWTWKMLVAAAAGYAQPASSITPRILGPIVLGWLGKLRAAQSGAWILGVDIRPLWLARPVEEREAVEHAVRLANAAAACAHQAAVKE